MKILLHKFLELFRESVITQSILVLLLFSAILYCVIAQIEIPQALTTWGGVIIGFFFGSKMQLQAMKGDRR
jgi:uncharacterized membrane protein AbrB (regulator of aidB expression)